MKRLMNNKQQEGMASIIIVLILMILMSLIGIGFSKLMDRAIRRASSNSLSAAAEYAALSGVNQVASYIKANPGYQPPATQHCDDLIKTGAPLAGLNDLSGNNNVKFTCILINSSTVNNLLYGRVPAYRSQVTKLDIRKAGVNGTLARSFMISWKADDPSDSLKNKNYPAVGTTSLLQETAWNQGGSNGKGYQPMMMVQFYPIHTGATSVQDDLPKTFYLYPNANNGTTVTKINYHTGSYPGAFRAGDYELDKVNCGATSPGVGFNYKTDYDCGAIFDMSTLVSSGEMGSWPIIWFVRMMPLYASADLQIQANDGTGAVLSSTGVQYVVDVTARANNVVKRLQARVSIDRSSADLGPDDFAFPEYSLRTSNTLCKRVEWDTNGSGMQLDPGSSTGFCNYNPPPVTNQNNVVVSVSSGSFPKGTGSVTSDDGLINCPASNCTHLYGAQTVTLRATPGPFSVFGGWTDTGSNPCLGQGNPCTFTPSGSSKIDAGFTSTGGVGF